MAGQVRSLLDSSAMKTGAQRTPPGSPDGHIEVAVCPVRGCGAPLAWGDRSVRCPAGHSFDRARSGYVNLLLVQDRRSKRPGDAREVVLARRRLVEAGMADAVSVRVVRWLQEAGVGRAARVLDAGCGEGFLLRRLHAVLGVEPWGVDISAAAVDIAAKSLPAGRWIVANADRRLPLADRAFAVVLAIAARRNFPEYLRLLAPGGCLVVGVPAPDDLAELREATQGRADLRDRTAGLLATLPPLFRLERRETARARRRLDHAALADLLAVTYRAGRVGVQRRLAELDALDVTFATELLLLRVATGHGVSSSQGSEVRAGPPV